MQPHPLAIKAALENPPLPDQDEHCIICTDRVSYWSVGECNHAICHVCSLRLRALVKNMDCPLCKGALPQVVYTSDPSKSFADFTLPKMARKDQKLSIFFDGEMVYEDTMILLRFNCPDAECDVACPGGWADLRRHVQKAHGKFLCDLCTKHQKLFTHEHNLYTSSELDRHYRFGDPSDTSFKGHPECGFCLIRFYGADELYEHCRQKHESCFLCTSVGKRHQYFENYLALEDHFRTDHFACTEPECLEKKFQVFLTDIDKRAHDLEVHPSKLGKGGNKIELNFQVAGGPSGRKARGGERPRASSSNEQTVSAGARGGTPLDSSTLAGEPRNAPPGFGSQLSAPQRPQFPPGYSAPDLPATPGRGKPLTWNAPGHALRPEDFPPPSSSSTATPTPQVAGDADVVGRLQALFGSNASRFMEFKSLATSFRSSVITADDFLSAFLALSLADKTSETQRRDAEASAFKLWLKLAETAPNDKAGVGPGQPQKQSQKERKRGAVDQSLKSTKKEEMLCALNDLKAKRQNEEQTAPLRPSNSYVGMAGQPVSSIITPSPPVSRSAASARVLVIKSNSKNQRIHAGGAHGSSESASSSAAPIPVSETISFNRAVAGPRSEHVLAEGTSHSYAPKTKDRQEFPSLPARPNPVPKLQGTLSNGAWSSQAPSEESGGDDGQLKGGKKGKGKVVLIKFG